MSDDQRPDAAPAAFEQVQPLIGAAITAQINGDYPTLTRALQALSMLGEAAFYGSLAVFAEVATKGVPRGMEPGGTWIPRLMVGQPPRLVEPETSPPAAFVLRFLAATLNGDEDMRLAVWRAFVHRTTEGGRDEDDASRELGASLVLMVQLAARGVLKERARAAHAHQHPGASRTAHPHRRNLRKR